MDTSQAAPTGAKAPCPCCKASALTFPAESAYGIKAEDLAPRYDCDCWKRVECQRCKRCAKHCRCLLRGMKVEAKRAAEAVPDVDPNMFPELPVQPGKKRRKRR